jgi:hypothetical protein
MQMACQIDWKTNKNINHCFYILFFIFQDKNRPMPHQKWGCDWPKISIMKGIWD